MNAQERWKKWYRFFRDGIRVNPAYSRHECYSIRREAALERQLAAAQRRIDKQAKQIEINNALMTEAADKIAELTQRIEELTEWDMDVALR